MRPNPAILLVVLLLFARVGSASDAAAVDPGGTRPRSADIANHDETAWFSYRDLYRTMIRFEKYGGPKQFIQSHLQVVPADRTQPGRDVRLTLRSRSFNLDLPLDALGRASFPFLKQAYDENAEVRANRPVGGVTLEPRLSIVTRADGTYDVAQLQTACEQVLEYQRYASLLSHRLARCAGVLFVFPRDAPATVASMKKRDNDRSSLAASEGDAWGGNAARTFKFVAYRFAQVPGEGQILCDLTPLAIFPLFE